MKQINELREIVFQLLIGLVKCEMGGANWDHTGMTVLVSSSTLYGERHFVYISETARNTRSDWTI